VGVDPTQNPPPNPPNYLSPALDLTADAAKTPSCDTNFGSAHPTTFNMAFCDGSVHSILYTVDQKTHAYLAQRADRNVIDPTLWMTSGGPPMTVVGGVFAP
jgi:prepilin-type processing-associated H-X9-DG protein